MNHRIKAREITKYYGVKLRYFCDYRANAMYGLAHLEKSSIRLNSAIDASEASFFSALFHEIGHIHCYKNNIWPVYHKRKIDTAALLRAFKLTAYKAECWIDKWAEKEMKKHLPSLNYVVSYRPKDKKSKGQLFKYYRPWINKTKKFLQYHNV